MNKLGIFFHPRIPAARVLAEKLARALRAEGLVTWVSSPWDAANIATDISSTDMLVCIGGDGTVLSAARNAIPSLIPILSIKMGKLGFLSEIAPHQALSSLSELLAGRYRVERRMMLSATWPEDATGPAGNVHALNDIVLSRATVGRPVFLTIFVDGIRLAGIRADAVIVATPTGSTGYNVSAGGPILHPEASAIVVTAVAPHLARAYPLVLPGESELTLSVESEHEALISVDGQVNLPLSSGRPVQIRRSPYTAHLVRFGDSDSFYHRLSPYLDMIPSE